MILSIPFLVPLLVLGIIILIHELGHFLSAIYFGIKVKEFAIGFGPNIFSIDGKLSKYSLKLIPLGGYVDIEGMGDYEGEKSFRKRPYIQQFIVLTAGIIMNFLLSFVIIFSISIYTGTLDESSNVVTTVISKNSVLEVNDRVIAANSKEIDNWKELIEIVKSDDTDITLKVIRDNKEIDINVLKRDTNISILSAAPTKVSVYNSLIKSSKFIYFGILNSADTIKRLILRKVKINQLSGPIGIMKQVNDNASKGLLQILFMMAALSVTIGFFNAIPFPPLDGGVLLLLTLEKLGIKIGKRVVELISLTGFLLLVGLSIWVGKNDISKLKGSTKIEINE